ncbi:MAG: hypothetical protein PUF10_04810 [Bacteroidales bacterium]|nr:hypothetical protein [Bacteroidales bacterium]
MTRKIINIVVFIVAVVAGVLAIAYASKFDDDKIEQYKAVCTLQEDADGQKVLDEFTKVKVETLDTFMSRTQQTYNTLDDSLRVEKKSADDFYNYVNVLKTTATEDFDGFKADYPDNVKSLLTFDKDGKYVKEFQSLKNKEELEKYLLSTLNTEYSDCRQHYLRGEEKCGALKTFLKTTEGVAGINDVNEKGKQLKTQQEDVLSFQSMSDKLLNPSFYIIYILFGFTFLALIAFALINIVSNFKTSYKVLLAILALFVVAIICYLVARPEVNNEVFMKLQISPETGKLIEAGTYLCYVVFFVAILTIIFCPLIARIRGNRSIDAAGRGKTK